MTIKTHSHDSGMLQTRFAPSVNYEYQVNMCMDFSPQYRFAPTGPSTHWSLWGGTCGNKKNNPTGKLVETVEVLDMTPPVSTLWDVLPLLRRFPKTKKRISWVVISIEYKKPLHIYIYGYFSKNWMAPIFTKHSSFTPFIHPLLRIRTMAHCCRNLAATIGISKTNCRTKGSKSGDLGKMV